MLDYTIFISNNGYEMVKFLIDGKKHLRHVSIGEDGEKYFAVPNLIHPADYNTPYVMDYRFTNRVKDAVETVKNGDADSILLDYIFGLGSPDAIIFVNREYGEKINRKFTIGFQAVEFCYAIQCGWSYRAGNNFDPSDGFGYMTTNLAICETKEDIGKILMFQTIEETEKYIKSLWEETREFCKEYKKCNTDTDRALLKRKRFNTPDHPYLSPLYHMFWSELHRLENTIMHKKKRYILKVSQCIVPSSILEI